MVMNKEQSQWWDLVGAGVVTMMMMIDEYLPMRQFQMIQE